MTYIVDPRATVDAGLALLPPKMTTDAAKRMLLAIGFQESGWLTTVQYGGGPAHSVWQMEGGAMSGIAQVMLHASDACKALCEKCGIAYTRPAIYAAMADPSQQAFACAVARLLLWTARGELPPPVPESEQAAWSYYVSSWHPGKPDRKRFTRSWSQALAVPLV